MTKTNVKRLASGIWTPWAEALCPKCHDGSPNKKVEKDEIEEPGFCTRCGAKVWHRYDVAQLTRLRKLVGGEMHQTGGMCAALDLNRANGETVIVAADECMFVAINPRNADETGEEPIVQWTFDGDAPDEKIAKILQAAINAPETVLQVAKELDVDGEKVDY